MRFPLFKVITYTCMLKTCLFLFLCSPLEKVHAVADIQFNTDILDLNDRKNIDLSQFSRSGYIMPGVYNMVIHINKNDIPEQEISFYSEGEDKNNSRACISPSLVEQIGLKASVLKELSWWRNGQCLNEKSVNGMDIRGDLSTSSLYLTIPQAYLEYSDENWDPPSRWDEGIPGIIFDYNVNARGQRQQQDGGKEYNVSGNGTAGTNFGPWRLRADWQGYIDHQTESEDPTQKQFDWSRYYAYRAIKELRSMLTLGENYLDSGVFDSFRFVGASLDSDDDMLPPNLRGYAPEVVGVAQTNAKVVIRQQGRVLYETSVPAGPFRIQDLDDAVSGELNVRVEEQNGSVHEFVVNTASIPYLTRPGSMRFKFASGKPTDWKHHTQGPVFVTGEYSLGISNGWSLYGGALAGGDYSAFSLGIGRDLMALGALSFDATQSRAHLPQDDSQLNGGSYRLSYSKRFDEYDSEVTFAGYRFSEEDYMSMSEYLDARYYDTRIGNGKEMYTISFNKNFRDIGLSSYISYRHETYWDRPVRDNYNVTLSHYLDVDNFRNISVSLSAYRNEYNGTNDDGVYLSFAIPLEGNATMSLNTTLKRGDSSHQVSYYNRIDDRSTYQLSVGTSRSGGSGSGYYTHDSDVARVSANASYQDGLYSAIGLSAQGGLTLTHKGGAVHRTGIIGGTRLLIDTQGVPEVPVHGYGSSTYTNSWGTAVIGDVSSYYRNTASIDLDKLSANAEATTSVVQATLTEGAIGYRSFEVIAGAKAMAVIKLANGKEPPFGAILMNDRKQKIGIVNDGGNVYLTGINPSDTMTVYWDDIAQCEVKIPMHLPDDMLMNMLFLPCQGLTLQNEKNSFLPVTH